MAQRKSKRNKGYLKKGSSKGWRRAALGGAAMAMAMANTIYVPPAYAVCPGTISGSSTAACTMTGADSLIITSTGKLDLSGKSTTAVYVDGLGNGATINNSGLIDGGYYNAISVQIGALNTTITNNTGASIAALGTTAVSLGGDLDGSLTNSGTIASGSSSYSTYDARAILIGGDLSGTLTNNSSGTISAVAANTNMPAADAYGIDINGDLTGSLINHGTISANASASASSWFTLSATVISVQVGNVSGSLTNTGTISAVATAVQQYSSDASAEAYGINMEGQLYGAISNSGTISAEANASAYRNSASANAYGIHASDVYGSLTNASTGTITATAHATAGEWYSADAFAAGIDIGELFGTLTNAGTISAEAHALATYTGVAGAASAEALGIAMNYMAASGTLDNSGTISAHATATGNANYSWSDSAIAKGIVVENGSLSGLLTNSGTITAAADANATSGSAQARAYGIEVSSELTGSLTNTSTGTISAKATAAANYNSYTNSRANASATGFSVNYFSGTLANAGTIKAEAEAYAQSSTADANAYGLETGTITGALTNGGTISATATASATGSGSAYASAIGVDISGSLTGRLDNSGTITAGASAYAMSSDASAYAAGIEINGEVYGSLTNTGTISAEAVATMISNSEASASAYGIRLVSGDFHGTLVNKGTIEATAQATCPGNSCSSVSADAYGIDINGDLTGSLDNSGTIKATATATSTNGYGYGSYTGASASASAFGVTVSDLTAALTNSGTITATATAKAYSDTSYGADARAAGIMAGDIESQGSLTNSGTISATASAFNSNESANASASGVRVSYVSGTVNNSGIITAFADAESLGTVILTQAGVGPAGRGFSSSSVNAGALGMGLESLLRTGTVTNSGTIKADAQATGVSNDASAYAIGIDVGENSFGPRKLVSISDRNVSGSLINTATGKIEANATANSLSGSADANAFGLNLGDVTLTGSVTNNGTISASADASAESGQASATAFGVRANSILGSLTNSGTIKATAVAQALGSSSAEATAYGLAVGNIETTGSVTNSGTIEASAQSTGLTSYNSASAYGLAVSNTAGTVTNSGTISATAIANNLSSWAGAYASGISLSDVLSTGSINNSGTITAMATAISTAPGTASYPYASASAHGISMSEMAGSLTNSGAISATATATANNIEMTSAYAEAYGLDVYGNLSGTVTNSGNISAVAKATNLGMGAWADAYGVRVEQSSYYSTYSGPQVMGGNLSGTLTNSGVISAVAEAEAGSSASAYAYGILVEGALTGTINNSGTISGFVAGDHPERGYSLYIADGSATVNNEAGGLLYGNLYTGGTVLVDNQGTISLPNRPTAFDAAMIKGDFNQGSTGKLEIGAASTVNYGQLTVDGTATLATGSGLAVDVAYGNTLVSGDTLADVVAAGTLNATTLAVTDNNGLLEFTAVIDGNTIDLGVTRNSATSLIEGAGNTGSSGAAALFDRLLASNWQGGGMDDALSVIWNDLQTAQQVSDAIGSTVPILNGDMPRAIAGAKHGINRIVRTRQAGNQGMNSGDGFFNDRNVWLKPFASTATQDDNNGAPGFDADSYGLMLGADGKFGDNFRLGFGFAYSSTDVDGNGGAPREAKVKSYQGNVYGTFDLSKGTELNWQADYGAHSNEITRNMPLFGRVASADYDSWSAHAGVEVAKDLAIGPKTSLTPSVRVDYTMITDDGYTETGAGSLNLTVDENETDELIFGIDGKLTHDFGAASITANLGVGYDALAGDDSITASFAGAPSAAFETVGIDPSPWLYGGGLGVSLGSRDKMEFTVRYDVEARQDFLDQSVSLKLQKSF